MSHSTSSLLPLAPTEVVGTLKQYNISLPYIGHWEQEGSRGSKREWAWRDPWPNRGGEHPKTCPYKWWGPQNIPLNHHYALPMLSQLWVRGARGGTLGSREVVGTLKIGPTGGRDPKTYHLMSITCYLCLVHWEWGEQALAQQRLSAPKTCPHRYWDPKTYPLNLHYPLPPLVHWEWGEQAESEGRDPWSKRSGGHPKNWPHRWWGPQNIPFDVHYPLPSLGPLGVRGASLGPTEVVNTPKLASTGSGVPKTYPSISITPTSLALAPLTPPYPWASLGPWDLPGASGSLGSLWKLSAALGLQSDSGALLPLLPPSPSLPLAQPRLLSLPGPLGPSWGLRKPWELLEAFGSLGSSVRLRGLAPPYPPLLSLAPCLPGPLGPSWGLRKPCKPSEAFGNLGSSVRLRGLASLTPLTPSCPLSLSGQLGPSWDLRKPCKPSKAFGSLGSSDLGALLPVPLTPSSPLSLPGSLGPQEALGLQSDSGALFPLTPLTSFHSLLLPLAPWAFLGPWGLRKPCEPLEAFGSLGSLVRLRGLAPPYPPLTPLTPWAFLGPQEALGAFKSLQQP